MADACTLQPFIHEQNLVWTLFQPRRPDGTNIMGYLAKLGLSKSSKLRSVPYKLFQKMNEFYSVEFYSVY